MGYESIPIGSLEIAGFDVSSLLWDQDEIEKALRQLALYSEFREHFREALELSNYATTFWLEDGVYSHQADSVIATVFRLRDVIYEHASYAETTSLPETIRRLHSIDSGITDSQLVATYGLVQSIQALQLLADWLYGTELHAFDIDAELINQMQLTSPKQFSALVEKERLKDRDAEIYARESFSRSVADAGKTIFLADLYRQVETVDVSTKTFNVSAFLRETLENAMSSRASQRAAFAGKGNAAPDSEKQLMGAELSARISQAARRRISANPKISETKLVRDLADKDKIASRPTIRKYLREERLIPR